MKKLIFPAFITLTHMALFCIPHHTFAANKFPHASPAHSSPDFNLKKCPIPGPQGPRGATGATGPTGVTGATGAAGIAGSSALIPFASGLPVTLTTVTEGQNTGAAVGFGGSGSIAFLLDGDIDLSDQNNFAFSVPEAGTITSIAAYFSTTADLTLESSILTITAQLYESTTPNNIFTPVPGAVVTFSTLTGTVASVTILSGITTGLSIPINTPDNTGTRLLLVFSPSVSPNTAINPISGYASGGITITIP